MWSELTQQSDWGDVRPPMIEHGPFYSHSGALQFARSKGGSLSTRFWDLPGWETKLPRHAGSPFFAGHID